MSHFVLHTLVRKKLILLILTLHKPSKAESYCLEFSVLFTSISICCTDVSLVSLHCSTMTRSRQFCPLCRKLLAHCFHSIWPFQQKSVILTERSLCCLSGFYQFAPPSPPVIINYHSVWATFNAGDKLFVAQTVVAPVFHNRQAGSE